MQGGHHLHTCTTSHPRGFPMVKPLKLSTLNGQLKCTMNGVGASENPKDLEQKRKHTGRMTIHET